MSSAWRVGVVAVFAAMLLQAGPVLAQIQSVDPSQPIVVKSLKPKNPKHLRFEGQFVSATTEAVTLRAPSSYLIRTFSYGPEAGAKMQQIAARGGFRYGDKVTIDYAAGTDVALRINGKPSAKSN